MPGPVVFIHIPKTAGCTFLSVLRRNFPVSDVLLPDASKEANRQELVEKLQLLTSPGNVCERSIHGHVPITYLAGIPEARFATLLREPLRRAHSHFKWTYGGRRRVTTLERALKGRRLIDNLQTRMLSGLDHPFTRPADDELLQAALATLDRLAFVGIVERFPESMLLAQERFCLRHVSYFRRNVRRTPVEPGELEALRIHNQLDLELYANARERVEPELDRFSSRAISLARADAAISRRRPVADPAVAGYVADFVGSAISARARRAWARTRAA